MVEGRGIEVGGGRRSGECRECRWRAVCVNGV